MTLFNILFNVFSYFKHIKISELNIIRSLNSVEFVKGPHKFKIYKNLEDLIDVNGLCASKEMLYIVKNELEIGSENLNILSEMDYNYPNRDMKIDEMRRFKLSLKEMAMIYKEIELLRGPHNCVYKGKSEK